MSIKLKTWTTEPFVTARKKKNTYCLLKLILQNTVRFPLSCYSLITVSNTDTFSDNIIG